MLEHTLELALNPLNGLTLTIGPTIATSAGNTPSVTPAFQMFNTAGNEQSYGILGGIQVGANYQYSNLVFGVEAGASGMNLKGSGSCSGQFSDLLNISSLAGRGLECSVRTDWTADTCGPRRCYGPQRSSIILSKSGRRCGRHAIWINAPGQQPATAMYWRYLFSSGFLYV